MGLRNGSDSFGLVTRVIHWGTMLLVIGMLALGNRIGALKIACRGGQNHVLDRVVLGL